MPVGLVGESVPAECQRLPVETGDSLSRQVGRGREEKIVGDILNRW